jgi:hypothetical protein
MVGNSNMFIINLPIIFYSTFSLFLHQSNYPEFSRIDKMSPLIILMV